MKKILLLLTFLCTTIVSYSQSGFSGIFYRVNDSTTYVNSSNTTSKHSAGYADIWYSTASQLFWKWNGSSYDLLASSGIQSIQQGTDITVDNTDPLNPFVSLGDGDHGDITTAGGNWTIDNNAVTTAKINNDAVTYAKMQNISAANRLLGRITAGAGDTQELTAVNAIEFSGAGIRWNGPLTIDTQLTGAFKIDFLNTQSTGSAISIADGLVVGPYLGQTNGNDNGGGFASVLIGTNNSGGGNGILEVGDGNISGAFNQVLIGTRNASESQNTMVGGFSNVGKANLIGTSGSDGSFLWGKSITGGRNQGISGSTAMFVFGIGNQVYDTLAHGTESSGIFGGYENRVRGARRAVVIGGLRISLDGATYDDHVAVPSLAIFTTPSAGGTDDILTWNATTKKVGKIAQPVTLSLIDGNATIFNTNKIDLGAFSANVSQNGNGWHWNIGASGNRLGDFRTWSSIVSMDATTSFNYQVGSNSVSLNTTDITLSAVDDIILNPIGSVEINGSSGTTGQVLTSQGSSPPIWTTVSGGGITNSGAADELVKSDGTNVIGTGMFSTAAGNVNYGSTGITGDRTETLLSSSTTSNKLLVLKGVGAYEDISTTGASGSIRMKPASGLINVGQGLSRGTVAGSDGGSVGGNLMLDVGDGSSSDGNIGLFTRSTTINFQSADRAAYIHNATSIPTAGEADGTFLYAFDAGGSSEIFVKNEAGTEIQLSRPKGSGTLDFGSIAAGGNAVLTVTVTGAADGDIVSFSTPNGSVTAGLIFTAWVSAANTVSIQCYNSTAGAIDPSSGVFKATCFK